MTRHHYIKKCMYLNYRLWKSPYSYNISSKSLFRTYDELKKTLPHPPFLDPDGSILWNTYQEAWDGIVAALQTIPELSDLE